jgi:uncharacterized protein YidB (DUF937 family)
MGILDQILAGMMRQPGTQAAPGQPGTQAAPQGNALLNLALQFVQNYPGGLAGLLQAFGNAGYRQQAQSWVSTGQNLPISPEVITQIFGGQQVQAMGRQFGLDSQLAAGGLASLLPEVIDQVTPNGRLESQQQDDLGALLEGVRGRLMG